jgi:hypothetical protein
MPQAAALPAPGGRDLYPSQLSAAQGSPARRRPGPRVLRLSGTTARPGRNGNGRTHYAGPTSYLGGLALAARVPNLPERQRGPTESVTVGPPAPGMILRFEPWARCNSISTYRSLPD